MINSVENLVGGMSSFCARSDGSGERMMLTSSPAIVSVCLSLDVSVVVCSELCVDAKCACGKDWAEISTGTAKQKLSGTWLIGPFHTIRVSAFLQNAIQSCLAFLQLHSTANCSYKTYHRILCLPAHQSLRFHAWKSSIWMHPEDLLI